MRHMRTSEEDAEEEGGQEEKEIGCAAGMRTDRCRWTAGMPAGSMHFLS